MRAVRILPAGILGATVGVLMATACSSSGGTPQVSDAIPRQISPAQRTFVVIEGDHFVQGAAARIGTSPLGAVTWVNTHVVTAEVPAGLPPGSYDVTISNPGGGQSTLTQAITVAGNTSGAGPAAAPTASTVPATNPPPASRTAPARSAAQTRTATATEAPARGAAPTTTQPPTQPPTQRATQQPAQPSANVGGTWMFVDTVTYGPNTGSSFQFQVVIQQNGAQLSGGGSALRFSGTVNGNAIHLDYVQDNGYTGTLDWTLSSNSASFDGTFTNSVGNGGTSTGQRLGNGNAGLVSTNSDRPAPPPPEGHGKKKDR